MASSLTWTIHIKWESLLYVMFWTTSQRLIRMIIEIIFAQWLPTIYRHGLYYGDAVGTNYRTESRFAPSQWETALLCNVVSRWLGASLESALNYMMKHNCVIRYYCPMHFAADLPFSSFWKINMWEHTRKWKTARISTRLLFCFKLICLFQF